MPDHPVSEGADRIGGSGAAQVRPQMNGAVRGRVLPVKFNMFRTLLGFKARPVGRARYFLRRSR